MKTPACMEFLRLVAVRRVQITFCRGKLYWWQFPPPMGSWPQARICGEQRQNAFDVPLAVQFRVEFAIYIGVGLFPDPVFFWGVLNEAECHNVFSPRRKPRRGRPTCME